MDTMVFLAQGFIGMFNKGGETFVGWVSGIIPTLVCLLVAMNSIIAFVSATRRSRNSRASAVATSLRATSSCQSSARSSSAIR